MRAATSSRHSILGELDELLQALATPGGGGARHRDALATLGALPPLDDASVTPRRLVALGLWSAAAAAAAEALAARAAGAARYFVGHAAAAAPQCGRV